MTSLNTKATDARGKALQNNGKPQSQKGGEVTAATERIGVARTYRPTPATGEDHRHALIALQRWETEGGALIVQRTAAR
jgi:hypothetical protein